jgi:hypothetical protein
MPHAIKAAFTRHYTDNDQIVAYVVWSDGSRTEGKAKECPIRGIIPAGTHMQILFEAARRQGLTITHETW